MVGVGVGSGEWQEFDSPHERDEPNLIILLRAPVTFYLATRTNKNEREQLDSSYISEMKMKPLHEFCSSNCVDNLATKKWEREFSWNQTSTKVQWKPEQRMWEEVWVSVWAWESSTPLSRPLFKENLASAPEEKPSTTVITFENIAHDQSLLEKDDQIIFQRILKHKNIFWYFCEEEKC